VGLVALGGFERYSGRGKKIFGKSIEIYKTNKIMKYLKMVQKCGCGSFRALEWF